MAEFSEVFDVERGGGHTTWSTFEGFIGTIRHQLRRSAVRFAHDLPVLPDVTIPGNEGRFFEIQLRTNTNTIGLRIRLCDLYLTHIQRPNSNHWISLENTGDQRTGLGYGGGYGNLELFCGPGRQQIQLGWKQLIDAVNELATNTEIGRRGSDRRACAVIIVIEMICESIRFNRISNYFATGVDLLHPLHNPSLSRLNVDARSFTPPSWMPELHNNWGDLSAMLLVADTNPGYRIPLGDLPPHLTDDIHRFDDLVLTLAVLAYGDVPPPVIFEVGNSTVGPSYRYCEEARNSTPGPSHGHDEL